MTTTPKTDLDPVAVWRDASNARAALLRDWGYAYGALALHAFFEAKDGLKPATSPMLSFTTKEGYFAQRAAWRARQRGIEARIRLLKAARRLDADGASSCAAELHAWKVLAHAALIERVVQKRQAASQQEAARQAAAAPVVLEAALA